VELFQSLESAVRSYSRSFPAIFDRAKGSFLYDRAGRRYIDFLAGAGALNYGHNHPRLKHALLEYIERDGITHSLDLATNAKRNFLERFESVILRPRDLTYRFQFTGPTGANGVEAALKLARKVTSRRNVVSFTGAFHGLSGGALAVTANSFYRGESYVNRADVSFLPYDGYYEGTDTIPLITKALTDTASGVDYPAAVILETVQSEGGINVATPDWLRSLQELCKRHGILLIVDDIQVGNGRTGEYFSFESAGLKPDVVVLSKSIGGFGLPMTLLLIKPEIDLWSPGEHTGTFRGNNLAFVAGTEVLNFWETDVFAESVRAKGRLVDRRLRAVADQHPEIVTDVRGRGLINGLVMRTPEMAAIVRDCAFQFGLIVELCGANDDVVKVLPPLTTEDSILEEGLDVLAAAIQHSASGT
jgi:diaminobutyrate-2-oxoglutarate transaminase